MTGFETTIKRTWFKTPRIAGQKQKDHWGRPEIEEELGILWWCGRQCKVWLHERKIPYTKVFNYKWRCVEQELDYDTSKILQTDTYDCYFNIAFEKRNDQLLFELTWKGRYDEETPNYSYFW